MKLEWKDPEPNEMSWDEAKVLEVDGWRLPTKAELCSAFHSKVEGFQSVSYWSSSTYSQAIISAWVVYFYNGFADYDSKTGSYYVRLCREVEK